MFGGGAGPGGFTFGGGMGGMGFGGSTRRPNAKPKDPPIERDLPVSLEEMFHGATKKLKISRRVLDPGSGTSRSEEKILTIDVRPGWKEGTKVTFPNEGDESPHSIPADVVFVIKQKPNPYFSRDGNDLVYTHSLPLVQALTGTTLQINTVDGRQLSIPINDIVTPTYEKRVPNEGMPVSKSNGAERGDLVIKFRIVFPPVLSQAQKDLIRQALLVSS
jgi:DnaJ homolog subfamily B member 13